MSATALEPQVLVAGGGPVGCLFAARLAQAVGPGLAIAVVDRGPLPPVGGPFDPRVVALNEASRRLLVECGLWDRVADQATPYRRMEVWDGEGTGHIAFDCREWDRPDLGHILGVAPLVEAARRRLAELGVVLVESAIVAAERPRPGGPLRLVLADGRRLTSPLVVGAEGARSLVRQACGVGLVERDTGQDAVVCAALVERPHGGAARQWFTRSGPLAFLPVTRPGGDPRAVAVVWSLARPEAERLAALDEAAFRRRLTAASESTLGAVTEVGPRLQSPLCQRHAERYWASGAALIGDAAHTLHPLAGQGVNLGLADAAALAEVLARGVARGLPVDHPSLLARYERRRRADNLLMLAAMEAFQHLFGSRAPALVVARNWGLGLVDRLPLLKGALVRRALGV